MKTYNYLFIVVLFFAISCTVDEKKKNMTVVFYNVENLFDLENEPEKNDDEFTPEGSKNWTPERYQKKLDDISRAISGINKTDLPEIVGLCEVENRRVLEDLIRTDSLIEGKYDIVHHESPDFRGIDCALIYRPGEFKVLSHRAINVRFEDEPDYVTRDILYVKGKSAKKQEFHIFVNHWPSRIGGVEQTEGKRMAVAEILKANIDSILTTNSEAKIIVMGDMNDEPDNKSLSEVIAAKSPESGSAKMFNLMIPEQEKGNGSYNYRNNWNMLDNLVVSTGVLYGKGFICTQKQGFVYQSEWMKYTNRDGEMSPNRTYGGPNYYGGVSDHFPVFFQLSLK